MMRLFDTVTLAATKLRAHRIRTGITIGIGGVLFGLLVGVAIVMQGFFSSVEDFSHEGLNKRYAMTLSRAADGGYTNVYELRDNDDFVRQVKAAHAELVAKKTAAVKKYTIDYDPKLTDPSPVVFDAGQNKEVIADTMYSNRLVNEVAEAFSRNNRTPFEPQKELATYSSASVLGKANTLNPKDGLVTYMKDGKEVLLSEHERRTASFGFSGSDSDRLLAVLPQTLAESFVTTTYDPLSGELPIILPFSDAEKLLDLKALSQAASPKERRDRIEEVRRRINEVTVSYCYRNHASEALVSQAKATADEIKKNANNKDYQKPSRIYAVPSDDSCGAAVISQDTRTPEQRSQDDRRVAYEKEVGEYIGEPQQYKLTFRAVGISADAPAASASWSMADLMRSLFSSSLGWGTWNIPAGLLEQTPESARPAAVFGEQSEDVLFDSYYIELTNRQEAQKLFREKGMTGGGEPDVVSAMPFGSSSLMLDEMRTLLDRGFFWVMLVVGAVAAIILSGIVGRTISDGRRETAVFRAIGASRGNMTGVYTAYTILFALRITIFALVLGGLLAFSVHLWARDDATIGAQLAFNAIDTSRVFSLFDLRTWYVPVIIGVIVLAGLLAAAVPLLRNMRRNPIRDMRDE